MLSHEQTGVISTQQSKTYAWFCQRAWVEIDLAALSHNVQELVRFLSPSTQLMAVVKADAYGHGAVTVAQTVLQSGASWLGVATVPEGIQLREAGIKAPILILGASNTTEQIHAIAQWKLQPTLTSPKQALVFSDNLEAISYNSALPVHIKLDTGMSRLGTNWQQAGEFVQLVQRLPHLAIKSIYSHLATADSPDPSVMKQQHKRFEEAIAQIRAMGIEPPCLHLANSAATFTDKLLHYDMVRVGLAVYGLYPAAHLRSHINNAVDFPCKDAGRITKETSRQFAQVGESAHETGSGMHCQIKPVLQVKARVTQVKTIAPGTGVSYGHQFIAERELRLAVVGIGYADGVPRNLSNKMQVLIRGVRVPQIGAITMDQLMLDVSAVPNVQEGEVVTVLGREGNEQISAEDWANQLNTISWEILCGFKHRLPRVAIG